MFGFKVETRIAKDKKNANTEATPLINIDKDDIKDISKTVATHVAAGAVVIMSAAAVLHTVSEVIINTTNPANKQN